MGETYNSKARPPSCDPELLKELYPKELDLKKLIIVHRHGDRTPLAPRLLNFLPKRWNFCKSSNLKSVDSSLLKNSHLYNYQKVVEHTGDGKNIPEINESTCFFGQLTDVGRNTLERNGQHLKKIYGDYLNFLPSQFKNEDFYLRSTDYNRTLESLQHLLNGMFETEALDAIIRTRNTRDENLFLDHKCNRLMQLKKEIDNMVRPSLKVEWLQLREKLSQAPELRQALEPKEFEHPTAIHQVYDSLVAAEAHGIQLPKLVRSLLPELDQLEVKLWFSQFRSNQEFLGLGIGNMLTDLKLHLKQGAQDSKDVPKVSIFSAHDTTVGPLVIGLGGFDGVWPPFGSMAMLELFQDKSIPGDNHYVRVKYNEKVLNLPACVNNHHPKFGQQFCELKALINQFDKIIPSNYMEGCKGFKGEFSDR